MWEGLRANGIGYKLEANMNFDGFTDALVAIAWLVTAVTGFLRELRLRHLTDPLIFHTTENV